MSSSCTPILVGMTPPVSEIWLPFKNGQISLLGHLIDRNGPKKFMQVGIDVKFIRTNFGGCDLFSFGDIATFKNGQISLLGHGLYGKIQSIGIGSKNLCK